MATIIRRFEQNEYREKYKFGPLVVRDVAPGHTAESMCSCGKVPCDPNAKQHLLARIDIEYHGAEDIAEAFCVFVGAS